MSLIDLGLAEFEDEKSTPLKKKKKPAQSLKRGCTEVLFPTLSTLAFAKWVNYCRFLIIESFDAAHPIA